ncbi:DUF6086 family protein [Kitasatospora sp. NBC_01287]|uniref:DUF6086 family protein n=1 Tax=Kitasatospora sp. NBC_01287 TaxID=2903573 RepID=UPI00225C2023|nr:DUF6086 family protein [Kitasatospora sp. NBC_01287]MCX4748852.1 DUF6086 family protein [Kitasatospora sp. NBC_01287]
MSCTFQVQDEVVWDASNTVARLYTAQVEAVAGTLGLASGIGEIVEDECEIDPPTLEGFLGELLRQYHRATHPILRSLTVGVIATSLVLLDRVGGRLPATDPDQLGAWTQLRDEHARSMPR